jgi:EAL domain-containing protein (putative c-di-GMP-specific phosphodiesterase class I)
LRVNQVLAELKGFGITISIDDFGTGYSSLSRVRELNVNCVKIDKLFVDKLLTPEHEHAITADIIAMAHKLGHRVIAEGVEDQRQLQYLREQGCDEIQGYLISKPIDEEASFELLKNS